MKFLVFTFPNEDGLKTPPPSAEFDAQTDWFRQRLPDGTLDCAYHGDDRAVFIFNAASREQLEGLIATIPLANLMQSKIKPLIDLFEHTGQVSGYLRGLEANRGDRGAIWRTPKSHRRPPARRSPPIQLPRAAGFIRSRPAAPAPRSRATATG